MNQDLIERLTAVQDAMCAAMEEADLDLFERLVSEREDDVVALAARVRDPDVAAFARHFIMRDRLLEARATATRDAVRNELRLVQRTKAAGRAYLSQGARG